MVEGEYTFPGVYQYAMETHTVIAQVEAGVRRVYGVATDDRGGQSRTATVELRINALPRVRIVSPLDGAVSIVTNELVFSVEASDPDGRA